MINIFAVWSDAMEREGVPNQIDTPTIIARSKTIHGYKNIRLLAGVVASILIFLSGILEYLTGKLSDR